MRRLGPAIVLALCAVTAAAQQQAPAFLYVHEEVAKPSMLMEYEKTAKEFGAMMRGANIPFYYNAVSVDDFHYYYVTPLKSFGDVDKMMQVFMVDLPQKVGKSKVSEFMQRSGTTFENTNEWLVIRRDDISYQPAKPRLKPEEVAYLQYDFYYVKPGMEEMVDQISNDWKSALSAMNSGDGFTVYQAVVGGDLPLVVVVTQGKSPSDLAAQTAKTMESLGDKANALNAKTMGIVRKFETKIGRLRPDLSNPAPKPQTASN